MDVSECMERVISLEGDIAVIRNDIKWMRHSVTGCALVVAAIFGVDTTGIL